VNLERLTQFLIELQFSNSKVWFDAHRPEYQILKLEFIELVAQLIAGITKFDPSIKGIIAKDTLFRINRDARFSNNKNPYKTHFSAAIASNGRHSSYPIYYLQLGIEESVVAGGIYLPETEQLATLRRYMAQHPKKADALLKNNVLLEQFEGLDIEHILTRFPKGYTEGSDLLKYKSFTVSQNFDALAIGSSNLEEFVLSSYQKMLPLHKWLREALTFFA
jgi:uncharacterized protein (TIGR02453 family)